MVGKKLLSLTLGAIFISASILTGCGSKESSASKKVANIGIVQLVEHPALDAAYKGFKEGLSSKGFKDGSNIKLDFQNAQGDIPTAQTMASNFASNSKDLILAIATPAAQAAYNSTKNIPILITAVTDPVEAGLAKSIEKSGTNVAGTSDALPMDKQFDLMKKLIPSCKKIGIIHNTSEANSEIQVKRAKSEAAKKGLEIIDVGINSSNEVSQALNSMLDKIDVMYTTTDNLVASSMSLIASKCLEKNIPVIGGEKAHVDAGALATEGIDYYKLGVQTGIMAADILNGKKPQDMPIEFLKETKLTINEATAQKLKITIPDDLKNRAELVKGGAK